MQNIIKQKKYCILIQIIINILQEYTVDMVSFLAESAKEKAQEMDKQTPVRTKHNITDSY